MKVRTVLSALILFLFAAVALPARPQAQKKTKAVAANPAGGGFPAATAAQVDRGRYLVEEVARCWECHTPRDANGQPDHSRWLQGAPIWIMPVHANPDWAMRAPDIAGFPSFTEAQGEKILEQGIGPNGLPIRDPMHTYHLTHDDAVAIIAYLRTVPRSPSPQ